MSNEKMTPELALEWVRGELAKREVQEWQPSEQAAE